MKKHPVLPLFCCLVSAFSCAEADAAIWTLSSQTGLIAPSGRGDAGNLYAGWDTFSGNPPSAPDFVSPIQDSTPDLPGSVLQGASIRTNNGEDHLSASGNYYSSTGRVDETVTAPASGIAGVGFTTIIAQGITAFGAFGSPLSFSVIGGISPEVTFGTTAGTGRDFFVAVWHLEGNEPSYSFTMNGGGFTSLDQLSVDTFWSPFASHPDQFIAVPEPGAGSLALALPGLVLFRRRRQAI